MTAALLAVALSASPAVAAASSSATSPTRSGISGQGPQPRLGRSDALRLDANLSSEVVLGFDDLPLETAVTTQYASEGILFSGPDASTVPTIAEDLSNPESPVLSGTPRFEGTIDAQFVLAGTTTPTSVNGLSLDVGYIDNPGSIQVVVHTPIGGEILVAEETEINTLSATLTGITGFSVERVGEEEAGFAIDNVSFAPGTVPLNGPPPVPSGGSNPCGHVKANFGVRVLRALECKYARTQNGVLCGAAIASIFSPLKLAQAAKGADGLYVLSKVRPSLKPLASLYNDFNKALSNPGGRGGFQNFGQLLKTLHRADIVIKVIEVLPKLPHADINELALDMAHVAGLDPCVRGLANVMK